MKTIEETFDEAWQIASKPTHCFTPDGVMHVLQHVVAEQAKFDRLFTPQGLADLFVGLASRSAGRKCADRENALLPALTGK